MSVRLGGITQSNVCGVGNKLFCYCSGLIYAHKHDLVFETGVCQAIERLLHIDERRVKSLGKGKNIEHNTTLRIRATSYDKNDEIIFYGRHKYLFVDYFQNTNYIRNNIDILKLYISVDNHYKVFLNLFKDVLNSITNTMHLSIFRFGEMVRATHKTELLDVSFYKDTFLKSWNSNKSTNESNKIMYILAHPLEPSKNSISTYRYLSKVQESIPNLRMVFLDFKHPKKELFDFYIVNHFENISLSTSTFNWWSIFVSQFISPNLKSKIKNVYIPSVFGYIGVPRNGRNYVQSHGIHSKNLPHILDNDKNVIVNTKFVDSTPFKKTKKDEIETEESNDWVFIK